MFWKVVLPACFIQMTKSPYYLDIIVCTLIRSIFAEGINNEYPIGLWVIGQKPGKMTNNWIVWHFTHLDWLFWAKKGTDYNIAADGK